MKIFVLLLILTATGCAVLQPKPRCRCVMRKTTALPPGVYDVTQPSHSNVTATLFIHPDGVIELEAMPRSRTDGTPLSRDEAIFRVDETGAAHLTALRAELGTGEYIIHDPERPTYDTQPPSIHIHKGRVITISTRHDQGQLATDVMVKGYSSDVSGTVSTSNGLHSLNFSIEAIGTNINIELDRFYLAPHTDTGAEQEN